MRTGSLLILILLLFVFRQQEPVSAQELTDPLAYLADAAGSEALQLPDDAQTMLDTYGISAEDPTSLLSLSPADCFHAIGDMILEAAVTPLKLLGVLLTLTMVCAGLGGLGDSLSQEKGIRRLFEMLCILLCIGTAAKPLCSCLNDAAAALSEGNVFMISFIPLFASFLAAGGHVATGAGYQIFLLFLTEGIGLLTGKLLFPLLQMSTALGMADSLNPTMRLNGLVNGSRKAVVWILGTVMALFAALLSIRSFVASAADGLSAKTAKLLSAGLIPVVGSAVSEAYTTVQGSIGLLRSGFGVIGILTIAWLLLPPLITVGLYRILFAAAGLVADLSGSDCLTRLYRNAEAVLSAVFAILISYGMMMILSTALMLLLLKGT
ncbi:MAG: hypothetical protein IKM30_03465 [Oscillospiraceae bacterium]|nr:hypothetical protein [Oscillospiraceae bacterium]